MALTPGTLYVLPTPLGKAGMHELPPAGVELLCRLRHFAVETPKAARRSVVAARKHAGTWDGELGELHFYELASAEHWDELIRALMSGEEAGLLSDAGAPAVADPGRELVQAAHDLNARVEPVVGPSSILLALMASGLNGQQFRFHGYLPREQKLRRQAIKRLDHELNQAGETQAFIETPYRNEQLLADLLREARPGTLLCIAADIGQASAFIHTRPMERWASNRPPLHKRPAVFLLGQAEGGRLL